MATKVLFLSNFSIGNCAQNFRLPKGILINVQLSFHRFNWMKTKDVLEDESSNKFLITSPSVSSTLDNSCPQLINNVNWALKFLKRSEYFSWLSNGCALKFIKNLLFKQGLRFSHLEMVFKSKSFNNLKDLSFWYRFAIPFSLIYAEID